MTVLSFPPLMTGLKVGGSTDPLDIARKVAVAGCDAGLVAYNLAADRIGAAVVLAPEVPLSRAMAMLPLAAVAFQNALGQLAPEKVPVFLEWSGGFRINGGLCGGVRVVASTDDPNAVPDWMVVGFELPLIRLDGDTDPDRTALYEEGCGDVDPAALVEDWARHTLKWIATWEEDGPRPLHEVWSGLAHGLGGEIEVGGYRGTFLGVDEDLGLLLKQGEDTRLFPLTVLLETLAP